MKELRFFLVFFIALHTTGQPLKQKPVEKLPSANIINQSGQTLKLDSLVNGKATIIDFWFIPCGPCFAEMHMLHDLYSKYKDNPKLNFLTITFSDSSFVRALTENHTTDSNDAYLYFKDIAHLDTFRLPVYFSAGYMVNIRKFKQESGSALYSGAAMKSRPDMRLAPETIFGFSGYPTVMIFDKMDA